jgi:hypothetical protein
MNNSLFLPMAGPIMVVLGLSTLFVLFGQYLSAHLLTRVSSGQEKPEDALRFAAAYSTGLAAFLTAWIMLDAFIRNAYLTFFLVVGIMVVIVIVAIRRDWARTRISPNTILVTFCLFLFFTTYNLSKGLWLTWERMPEDLSTVGIWEGIGVVVHSFRAGNIAIFIHDQNYIPVLPQHIVQSLLAVTSSLTGFHSPQYSLLIWHATMVAFFIISIYATMRAFTPSAMLAALGTVIVSAGNLTFSNDQIHATDSGSIPIMMKSIDSIIGLATLLLFTVIALRRILTYCKSLNPALDASMVFVLVFSWCVCATQNLFVAPPTIAAALIIRALHSKKFTEVLPYNWFHFFIIFGAFTLAAIAGSLRGGMLVPARFHEHSSIPGVSKVAAEGRKPVVFHAPEVASASGFRRNPAPSTLNPNGPLTIVSALNNFVVSGYYILFPASGIILFLVTFLRKDSSMFDHAFLLTTAGLFIFGLFIQSSMEMYGRSWELSRFFYAGLLLAMVALGLGIIRAATWIVPRSHTVASILVIPAAVTICATPISDVFGHYWRAFLRPLLHGGLDWSKPLEFVLTLTHIVGKN